MRNLEMPGRSPVHAPTAMAATSHPLATETAIRILRSGGNALDAAIGACAVQCVVEPESTGIGGDAFCIYAPEGSDELVAFNGSGRAPAAATPQWYAKNAIEKIERQTPHAVTVPGAVDAWEQLLNDYGSRTLGELLQPAIAYAKDGYPVSSRVSVDFASQRALLANDPAAAEIFLFNGKTPSVGTMHRQPALASTLMKIAETGRDAFYTGEVADDIVSFLQSKGGLHTMDDFAAARGEYVDPISTNFRGVDVYQCPPNGQGVIALLLLNVMRGIGTFGDNPISIERIHAEIEAGRLAYKDRNLYVADPSQAHIPVEWLLADDHADEIRNAINPDFALNPLPEFTAPQHDSTVYITVVDKDRNCCSFINTLFANFGSVQMAPKSGVFLQNRGQGFVLDPDHPNCIGPGKRPLHTIIPGMGVHEGRAVMPFGVMGGQYQAFGHMQFMTRLFDFGLDIQQAQDHPRFFPNPYTGEVEVESTVPEEIVDALRKKGHKIVAPAKPIGGSQAIWVDWEQNVLTGGSDPRKDGCAMGY
ncbi:MAG: gamma-glutamyltransferase [Hyphomicrobiaceae bacterium]